MNAMNLTLAQVAAWVSGAQVVGHAQTVARRVHSDTRTLAPGDLFVAIRGERFDAAQFLLEAAGKGAAAALCDARARDALLAAGLPGVLVPDARKALGELAAGWRQQFELPLIAVTGSNGKTTVTQMLASILRAWQGDAALATRGNFNNDIGVPMTLLALRQPHRAAVVELGMNHPGEIIHLARMARPTVALVNNAQREHQEFMVSVAAVAEENGQALAALPTNGVAVFPADDAFADLWRRLSKGRRQILFGDAASGGAQVFVRSAQWQGQGWQVQAQTPQGALSFAVRIAGRHNVRNALAAVACAQAAGAPGAAITRGLDMFRAVAGRSCAMRLKLGGNAITLVDDTYNANPDSVRAAIDLLAGLPAPRVLALGDMAEVGAQGPQLHREAGQYARARGIDHVFTLGDLAAHAAQAFGQGSHFDAAERLSARLLAVLDRDSSVLVKGSRFMKMERVVQALVQAAEPQETADAAPTTAGGRHAG
jgi:UDP-N-acetylmuramoyl-tripeptide--D-alanyl-D-alanine ligase